MKRRRLKRGYKWIFTTSVRTRSGRRIYAWQYGLKAFCIQVKAA